MQTSTFLSLTRKVRLGSELRHRVIGSRVYATHFILSFLRFFAQSTR
jgi:hypothetical protein